jgi:hypothetical protein
MGLPFDGEAATPPEGKYYYDWRPIAIVATRERWSYVQLQRLVRVARSGIARKKGQRPGRQSNASGIAAQNKEKLARYRR